MEGEVPTRVRDAGVEGTENECLWVVVVGMMANALRSWSWSAGSEREVACRTRGRKLAFRVRICLFQGAWRSRAVMNVISFLGHRDA